MSIYNTEGQFLPPSIFALVDLANGVQNGSLLQAQPRIRHTAGSRLKPCITTSNCSIEERHHLIITNYITEYYYATSEKLSAETEEIKKPETNQCHLHVNR